MKFACDCGATVHDVGDYKGYLLADLELAEVLEAIDRAIETGGPAEARAMAVRRTVQEVLRPVWQCRDCSRLHVQRDDGSLQDFAPAASAPPSRLFRAKSR